MPLSFVGVEVPVMLAFSSLSLMMVEVEGDLEKVLARGPRCVSLSSTVRHRQQYSRYQIQANFEIGCDLTASLHSFQDEARQDERFAIAFGRKRWIGTYSW